ncbi:PhzF family phenazine biosynthesis protein [Acidaminobacter hydrogenoformans]|uniref:Phenazine biosynthesis protein PhzF family n=1 Tax=Acidaminobacter hydrogenoformans DSM 2784 TaxID=1120920 RepID=A0A1G5RYQ3_9FIRM|nr:PhzF family phenazine biosynthesis protein [Acidaminobacter hydrogenoformans]SCZ78449.1 phenazine biosynthesis protein PhzF family [Acidaminobacter hydrogenoformans DSM 2784]
METKQLQYFHVDAFTEVPFAGSPTGVILMDEALPDEVMQAIAAELNHSETAFVAKLPPEAARSQCAFYALRWFTPEVEVQLSGSATLAAAKVLQQELGENSPCIVFKTLYGEIFTRMRDEDITITLPLDDYEPLDPSEQVLWYLGINNYQRAVYSRNLKKLIIEVDDELTLSRIKPDFNKLRGIDLDFELGGLSITCRSSNPLDYDFASRYFNPWIGVDEDTITGSIHTVLALYWSRELKKQHLVAVQASKRAGRLILDVTQGNVDITGCAYVAIEGQIRLPIKE